VVEPEEDEEKNWSFVEIGQCWKTKKAIQVYIIRTVECEAGEGELYPKIVEQI
jgi:hypothetical protein